jgi:ADP-heptose:LPS heptosyltransferase
MQKFKKIIISRTDNLGDVILTIPMAGIIKSIYKDAEIFLLERTIQNLSFHQVFILIILLIEKPSLKIIRY